LVRTELIAAQSVGRFRRGLGRFLAGRNFPGLFGVKEFMKPAAAASRTIQKPAARKAREPDPKPVADALGPRLSQILQHRIQPWRREQLGEEEAQLAEIKRRPVRNRFDADEAKRRLGIKPVKRSRTAKPKAPTV
jgi:hypothetical protein